MIGKITYLLTFLVTIAVVAGIAPGNSFAISGPHNLTVGYPVSGDRLVLRKVIFKKALYDEIIRFEETFDVTRFERITQVKAVDQMPFTVGGFASLLKGGPGTSNVTLRFRSQRGQGLFFVVDIYSKERPINDVFPQ